MIITKNNIQNLVENLTLEVLSEEEQPAEAAAGESDEEKGAERYPFMKNFLKTGDVSILKQNKQEVFNLVAELVSGIGMSLSELADIEKSQKKEQEKREREQRRSPGQSRTEPEPKLGDAINDKGEEIKPGEEEAIELGDEDIEHLVDKDAPLSVMKKQKNIKGEDSKPEEPIVGKLEKMIPGLGQSGAQFLAKSIASYLKKRGLPVAESNILSTANLLLAEATNISLPVLEELSPEAEKQARSGRVKSFTAGIRRNLSKNLADDPKKQKKFLYKVINLSKQGRTGLEQLNQNLGSQLNDEEIASAAGKLQKWASNALSTWGKEGHASGDSFRDLQANMQTNIKNIKAAAKDMDPLGKVIARSLVSNYGNAAKNPGLAKLLSDPKGIARISVSIKHFLQKQLQLRGKDTADIQNLMEQLTIVMDRLLKEGNKGDINPGDKVELTSTTDIPEEIKRISTDPNSADRSTTGRVAAIEDGGWFLIMFPKGKGSGQKQMRWHKSNLKKIEEKR